MSASAPPAPGLAQSFALILDGLCKAAAARMARHPTTQPLLMLLWVRLRRTMARFALVAERAATGHWPTPHPKAARRAGRTRPRERLPRGSAWLFRLLPGEAACYGSQLQHLLSQPEMATLIATTPQAGRILRPLCRMLGVPLPAGLALPAKPTTPAPSPPEASPPDMGADPPDPAADPPRRSRDAISWQLPSVLPQA